MKRYMAILLCTVMAIGFVACQPTPEKEPVVVKTEDYVAEAIQPKDGTHDKYDAPNNVEFHNEISGLDLTINAPVVIPQTDVFVIPGNHVFNRNERIDPEPGID